MKKLVNYNQYYKINDEEWVKVNFYPHIMYREENEVKDWESREFSFQEFFDCVKNGNVLNAEIGYTMFLNRPYIKLPPFYSIKYYEKDITKSKIKITYEPFSASISKLAKMLDADEFCEWLKDHEITKIITK